MLRLEGSRRATPVLTLAVGFLLGVMVAAIVAPDLGDTPAPRASGATRDESGLAVDAGPDSPFATDGQGGRATSGGSVPARGSSAAGSTASASGSLRDIEPPAQRGVTTKTIRLGVALPDIGAIAALGPGYDQGSPRDHVDSILAALRRDKVLPIAGRDLEVVYRTFNILSAEEQRATCTGFVQDDKVFAVIGIHNYVGAAECLAAEYRVPVLTANGPFDGAYKRGWPWLFTLEMSATRVLRNFVAWGESTGRFKGKRIGVYYADDPGSAPDVEKHLIDKLRQLGHNIASTVTTDAQGSATGGPNDTVAVQRFRAAEVNLALLIVSPVAKTNFFTQARQQGYDPEFLETDLAFGTTTTGTSTYPPEYFDGTYGVTGQRFGEAEAGIAESPESAKCGADFTRHTGRAIDREAREAEYIMGNQACDEFRVFLAALAYAGRNLTPARLVAGLETVKTARMGIHGDITFSATVHDGVQTFRELRWKASCRCWAARPAFQAAVQ